MARPIDCDWGGIDCWGYGQPFGGAHYNPNNSNMPTFGNNNNPDVHQELPDGTIIGGTPQSLPPIYQSLINGNDFFTQAKNYISANPTIALGGAVLIVYLLTKK